MLRLYCKCANNFLTNNGNGCIMVVIRKATLNDINQIKIIADNNRKAIGFLRRPALKQAIENEEVFAADWDGKVIGFQTYHHRIRDLNTTLYHKCVSTNFRRKGVGTKLVDAVVKESLMMGRELLMLKCPVDLEANEFHRDYGFTLAGVEQGKKRRLNIWILELPR